jgi:hypothetical protein
MKRKLKLQKINLIMIFKTEKNIKIKFARAILVLRAQKSQQMKIKKLPKLIGKFILDT